MVNQNSLLETKTLAIGLFSDKQVKIDNNKLADANENFLKLHLQLVNLHNKLEC